MIIIGIAVRLVLGYLLTYNYDVYHWALTISNFEAGNGLYEVAGYYYSPVWGYILGVFSQFTGLFGVDLLGDRFAEMLFTEEYTNFYRNTAFVTTPAFNTAVTVMLTLFDLLNAYLIFWIVREVFGDVQKARMCFALWFICAFVIVVGATGGMFDTISATFVLLCIATLIKGQEFIAGAMFASAVLLKFFPVFMVFILVAYILVKHNKAGILRIAKAIIGALAIFAVVMLPPIMDGHLGDSFSFLSARATGAVELIDILMSIDGLVVYTLIMIAEAFIAVLFLKTEHDDIDKGFLWFAFIAIAIVFLNPSSPQYILVMAPLLIIMMVCKERMLRIPFAILCVGTSLYALSPIVMDLSSMTMYGGAIPFESWSDMFLSFESKFMGISGLDLWSIISGIIQYTGIVAIAAIIIKKQFPRRRTESGNDREISE